jgi:hypothetical protein
MENTIILGRNNSFISYCSIFSKDLILLYPPQLCQIGFLSKEIFDIIVMRGLTLSIKIFLPFSSEYIEKFTNFLILSYSYFKKNNLSRDKSIENTTLNTLKSNLNEWEIDHFEELLQTKNKVEFQKLFEIEIFKELIDDGCICLLKFKDCDIATYFFNRFNKSIKINDKEYLIKILTLNELTFKQNDKKKLEINDYFLSQINNKYGIYENETCQIKINPDNREYFILFHPFKLISNEFENIYYKNFNDFITKNILRNKGNINYNINFFYIKSKNVFNYNKITINKEYISYDFQKIFNIKQIETKKKKQSKIVKIDKSDNYYNNTREKYEKKTQQSINMFLVKDNDLSKKRKRDEEEVKKIEEKPKKFTKIDQYFKLNK